MRKSSRIHAEDEGVQVNGELGSRQPPAVLLSAIDPDRGTRGINARGLLKDPAKKAIDGLESGPSLPPGPI